MIVEPHITNFYANFIMFCIIFNYYYALTLIVETFSKFIQEVFSYENFLWIIYEYFIEYKKVVGPLSIGALRNIHVVKCLAYSSITCIVLK